VRLTTLTQSRSLEPKDQRPSSSQDWGATNAVTEQYAFGEADHLRLFNRARQLLVARESVITLGLLLLVCATYSLLLVNSYFPITEGWFQDFSNYMDRGQVMYRDFYMFVPPGFPLLMHAIASASNDSFLAFRLYGVSESLVLIGVSYTLLLRLFSARIAFVAVLTAFVLYTANLQDIFWLLPDIASDAWPRSTSPPATRDVR
jgi:hypothetical protein